MFHKIFNQPTTFLSLPKYLERILMPDASTTRYTRSTSRSDDLPFIYTNKPRIARCAKKQQNLELMHLNTHSFIDLSKTGIIYEDNLAYLKLNLEKYFGLMQERNLSRNN